MTDELQVWFVTEETAETIVSGERSSEDVGGGFGDNRENIITKVFKNRFSIPRTVLKSQINGLLQVVTDLFTQTENQQQLGMALDEVELSIEVNSEGQVSIVGSGGKLGEKGSIKLKFKRIQQS